MKKLIMLLCICLTFFTLTVSADEALLCEIADTSTITDVQINSTANVSNLILYRAIYKNNKLTEITQQNISLELGTNNFTFDETSAECDKVSFFCWDTNLCPKSNALSKEVKSDYNVIFKDWNGLNISEQSIKRGGTALLPTSPARSGYIFAGWDGIYSNIYEDTTINARYIAPDADNVFGVSSASGNVGEEVTVTISLSGNVKTCGFDMKLLYDTNALEYITHEVGTAMDVNAGYNTALNCIRFNFSANKNRTRQANVMTVTFKIKEAAKAGTVIKLEPVEVLSTDENYNILFIVPDLTPRSDVGINFVDGVVIAE